MPTVPFHGLLAVACNLKAKALFQVFWNRYSQVCRVSTQTFVARCKTQ